MFVKTQFDTIVNVTNFDKIKIEWSVKSSTSENVYHIISAVSEERTDPISIDARDKSGRTSKSETLAQFRENMDDKANRVYHDLCKSLSAGKTYFDMTQYTEPS